MQLNASIPSLVIGFGFVYFVLGFLRPVSLG